MLERVLKCLLSFLLVLSAPALAAIAEPVGRVQVASGDVQATGPNKIARPLARGDLINEGDTITTGPGAAVHIRMSDEGIIALRPNSTLAINSYRWMGREDGTESAVLSLVKGGFRTITGVIGRTNKSNYLVNTPTSTIGIRGTDHEPFYIPPPGPGETLAGEPGTYNKVNVGETFIRSPAGVVELGANEVGFASLQPGVAPVKLERIPEFMRAAATPRGKPDLRGVRELIARDPRRAELVQALRERNLSPREFRQALLFRIRTANEDFDISGQSGAFHRAPDGTALAGSILFREQGDTRFNTGSVVVGTGTDAILVNRIGEPLIVSDTSGFRYSREGAPVIDRGAAVVDGADLRWGVYAGGLRFDERDVSRVQLFTFMQTSMVTPVSVLQQPGVANYNNTVGHTAVIDDNGRAGGTARLNARVVFGANPRITDYNLLVRDASARNWAATLNGPQSLQSFARSQGTPNLTVSCPQCGGAGQGVASGLVVGPTGGGMISSYGLRSGTSSVTGSIAVSR